MEIWKTIEEYDEYEVSSYGRVRSKDRDYIDTWGRHYHKVGQIIKPEYQTTRCGYIQVMITISSKKKIHRLIIARLVAKAFIPNPNNLPQVNHKDENSLNNHVDNLEWCDAKYNINYGDLIGRRSNSKKRKIKVFDENHNYIETLDSGVDASNKYNVSRGSISTSCHHNTKIKGYYFEFEN